MIKHSRKASRFDKTDPQASFQGLVAPSEILRQELRANRSVLRHTVLTLPVAGFVVKCHMSCGATIRCWCFRLFVKDYLISEPPFVRVAQEPNGSKPSVLLREKYKILNGKHSFRLRKRERPKRQQKKWIQATKSPEEPLDWMKILEP